VKKTFNFDDLHSEGIMGEFDLEQFSNIYPKEWLAVAVLEEQQGRPVRGYLLAHSQDRARVERSLRAFTNQRILFFYSGAQTGNSEASA
jgi:hypothetical protein